MSLYSRRNIVLACPMEYCVNPSSRVLFDLSTRVNLSQGSLGPGTWDLGLETWDLGPETWDLKPGTWDLGPGILDLGPGTWEV